MAKDKYADFYERLVKPIINQSWLDAGYTQEQIDSGEALRIALEASDVEPYPWLADAIVRDATRCEAEEAALATAG